MTMRPPPPPRSEHRDLAGEVVVIGSEPRSMMQLTAALAGMRYSVTAIDAIRPIDTAQSIASNTPLAMIVSLDGTENVVDIRWLLTAAPHTRFVFLAHHLPPRASIARILNSHGATMLHRDDAVVVVVSTLVAALSRPRRIL